MDITVSKHKNRKQYRLPLQVTTYKLLYAPFEVHQNMHVNLYFTRKTEGSGKNGFPQPSHTPCTLVGPNTRYPCLLGALHLVPLAPCLLVRTPGPLELGGTMCTLLLVWRVSASSRKQTAVATSTTCSSLPIGQLLVLLCSDWSDVEVLAADWL